MKKLILVAVLALGLGGCQQVQKLADFTSAIVVGISNPITENELYALENSMIVAFAGLNTYKRACINNVIPSSCRRVIQKLQVYTRRLPAALATLRKFVKENDQVNARVAYDTFIQLWNDFKGEAARNKVVIQ